MELKFLRYPASSNRSLQAKSAADDLLLEFAAAFDQPEILIQHDRFGVLTTSLFALNPTVTIAFASQWKAVKLNLNKNLNLNENKNGNTPNDPVPLWGGGEPSSEFISSPPLPSVIASFASRSWGGGEPIISPLDIPAKPPDLVLLRMPKSLDLFELYLRQIANVATPDTQVVIGFMTRYFTPQMLKIAERYASDVQQSKAKKKARLLVLKGLDFKVARLDEAQQTHAINFNGRAFQQYFGVFSAGHIDYATQYLLPFLTVDADASLQMLDIGCGNGVIGQHLLQQSPDSELTVTDDSYLAIASARLNLDAEKTRFLFDDTLDHIADDSIDLAVTNPPFHLEYETNIEVSLRLFRDVTRVLKPEGVFYVVANRHLNYSTHLKKLFSQVEVLGENEKFVVYSSRF